MSPGHAQGPDGAVDRIARGYKNPRHLLGRALVRCALRTAHVRLLARSVDREVVEIDGRRHAVEVQIDDGGDDLVVRTRSAAGSVQWTQAPRYVVHDSDESGGGPHSPLPGTVIAVHVEVGQSVRSGDLMMVVEAMKMEHKITAATDAVITDVRFAVGDRVDQGDLLVALEVPGE